VARAIKFKPGAFVVAKRAGVPAFIAGRRIPLSPAAQELGPFFVPRPFSCVRIRCSVVSAAEIHNDALTAEELQRQLQAINPD